MTNVTIDAVQAALDAKSEHATCDMALAMRQLETCVLRIVFEVLGPFPPESAKRIGLALAEVGDALALAGESANATERVVDAALEKLTAEVGQCW